MVDWTRIFRVVVPVVLIVSVLATTTGMVWHHHDSRSSADQCTLCHLVIAPAGAATGVCGVTSAPADYELKIKSFIPGASADQTVPRAPPS